MKKQKFIAELYPLYNADDEYLIDLLNSLYEITNDVDKAKRFLDWLYRETMLVLGDRPLNYYWYKYKFLRLMYDI